MSILRDLWYDIIWTTIEQRGVTGVKKKWWMTGLMAGLCLLLSGCLFRSPSDLYEQPAKSAGYEQLNQTISDIKSGLEAEFGTSVENAVIVSGDNTATIQLQDLDGDGQRESAVTFMRLSGVENNIKIYVFRQIGDTYAVSGIVEGDGAALYSVDYVDLNGSGKKELVVNWQVSTGVYQLGAYTLDEVTKPVTIQKEDNTVAVWQSLNAEKRAELLATELLLTKWSGASDGSRGYCLSDLDKDTQAEVAVVRIDASGVGSHVEVYDWMEGALTSKGVVSLSTGIKTLVRLRSNYVGGELYPSALYVSSTLQDGERVVDVLTWQDGQLINSSMDEETGVSREVIIGYTDVNMTDINADMILELPKPSPLPVYASATPSNFYLINWYQYQHSGDSERIMTTYHNVADSWYLEIPDKWKNKITIYKNDTVIGQREVIFAYWQGTEEPPVPFLSIYRFTGTNRTAASTRAGRFVLREEESVIYSAKFYDTKFDCGLDETGLMDRFHIIQSGWEDY